MRVREAMTSCPVTCEPRTTVRAVAKKLADFNCAAIPVTSGGKLLGIITDRDIACRGVASGNDAPTLPVSAFMTAPVLTVGPDDDLLKAATLMEDNRIHHLPVVAADGTLVGILAQSDIGKRMTDREFGWLARQTSIPHVDYPTRRGLIRRSP